MGYQILNGVKYGGGPSSQSNITIMTKEEFNNADKNMLTGIIGVVNDESAIISTFIDMSRYNINISIPSDLNEWSKNDSANAAISSINYNGESKLNTIAYSGGSGYEAIYYKINLTGSYEYTFRISYLLEDQVNGMYVSPYCPYFGFFNSNITNGSKGHEGNTYSYTKITTGPMTDYITYECKYIATSSKEAYLGIETGCIEDGKSLEIKIKNIELSKALVVT